MLGGIVALLSCGTEPCACPPSRTHVVVTGSVTRSGAGLPDAQIRYQEQPDGLCPAFDSTLLDLDVYYDQPHGWKIGDNGVFSAHPYSLYGPTERCLVVTVAADGDMTRVEQNALFRLDREIPETVHVDLILGPP